MKLKQNSKVSKLLTTLAVLVSLVTSGSAFANTVVPSGTEIPAIATMELSSEDLFLGQSVWVGISQDFYYNNNLIIPIGSSINGTVTAVKKAGNNGVNGEFLVKFTNISTPYGRVIPVSAKIKTSDKTGVVRGMVEKPKSAFKEDLKMNAASGAVAGVILGELESDKYSNDIDKAASFGAAYSAGKETAKTAVQKGKPAVILTGEKVNIVAEQQITVIP